VIYFLSDIAEIREYQRKPLNNFFKAVLQYMSWMSEGTLFSGIPGRYQVYKMLLQMSKISISFRRKKQ